jgi:hypothetical protein
MRSYRPPNPRVAVYIYEKSGHGFNNDGRPDSDPNDAALARKRTIELFETNGAMTNGRKVQLASKADGLAASLRKQIECLLTSSNELSAPVHPKAVWMTLSCEAKGETGFQRQPISNIIQRTVALVRQ